MNAKPIETNAPPKSRIAEMLTGASFYDSWSITSSDVDSSALDHFIAAVKRTPRWIEYCMTARNKVGNLFGLKDLGTLSRVARNKPASEYIPGERVGIFTLFENSFDEALIGDRDKHLNVMLSIHREALPDNKQVAITVTTVVHVKNMLGRLYMLPVKPMHRIIAPAVLNAIASTSPMN